MEIRKFRNSSIIMIFLLLTLIVQINVQSNLIMSSQNLDRNLIKFDLIPHNPIAIKADADFETNGFLGAGIEGDPFRIEDLNITDSSGDIGIEIFNTTKFFIIQNCFIKTNSEGIYFNKVANDTAKIMNNIIKDNQLGVHLFFGRYLRRGGYVIANNHFINNGIYSIGISDCNITNNTFLGKESSITMRDAYNSTTRDNRFTDCAIYFDFYEPGCDTYYFDNNTINGKDFGWIVNQEGIIIDGSLYNQLYLIKCNEAEIINQELPYGAFCAFSSNLTYRYNEGYFNFHETPGSIIEQNVGSIYLEKSENCTIRENTGILSVSSSNITIIQENDCYYSDGSGLYVLDGCYNSSILKNSFCHNSLSGIVLFNVESMTIQNNTIENNQEHGIVIYGASSNEIKYNNFTENTLYGISILGDSSDNIIHHNLFIDNNLGGTSQAYDEGIGNLWYDTNTQEGNEWSDWTGETAYYSIDGASASKDQYPLGEPHVTEFSTKISIIVYISFIGIVIILSYNKKRK